MSLYVVQDPCRANAFAIACHWRNASTTYNTFLECSHILIISNFINTTYEPYAKSIIRGVEVIISFVLHWKGRSTTFNQLDFRESRKSSYFTDCYLQFCISQLIPQIKKLISLFGKNTLSRHQTFASSRIQASRFNRTQTRARMAELKKEVDQLEGRDLKKWEIGSPKTRIDPF